MSRSDLESFNEEDARKDPVVWVPRIVMRDRRLTEGARAVYLCMMSFTEGTSVAFCGPELLAETLRMSRRRVVGHLRELVARGLTRPEPIGKRHRTPTAFELADVEAVYTRKELECGVPSRDRGFARPRPRT